MNQRDKHVLEGGLRALPADVGDVGCGGPGAGRTLVVGAAGESGEPLGLEDLGDRDRAEGMPRVVQHAADVVDREVLLAQGDDLVVDGGSALGAACGPLDVGVKKIRLGSLRN